MPVPVASRVDSPDQAAVPIHGFDCGPEIDEFRLYLSLLSLDILVGCHHVRLAGPLPGLLDPPVVMAAYHFLEGA